MIYDTDITIRTDSAVKHEAAEIFDALGIDACTAVNMFLRQVIIHHGLPFRVALEPDIDMGLDGEDFHGPFDSVKELMADLTE